MSRQKPICFIDMIEEGDQTKFRITDEARKILETLNKRLVAPVAIAGPQRTGKSF